MRYSNKYGSHPGNLPFLLLIIVAAIFGLEKSWAASILLGINDAKTFNTALNIAKRYSQYTPVLPYVTATVPQVHHHIYNFGNHHRTERIGTLKSSGDAWTFCQDQNNVNEYGNDMHYTKCRGETCNWLRNP